MKTTSKLLCLIAVVGAIFAAMWFAHYIVTPPNQQVEKSNQYLADLNNCIDTLKNASTEQQDNLFLKYLSRIRIFEKEERINASAVDDFYRKLLDLYAPLFTKECFNKFTKNMWYKSDHDKMLNIISALKEVKCSNGQKALSPEHLSSLNSIEKIIKDYDDAWAVSRRTAFNGSVDSAIETINKATKYASDEWLQHCTALCQALKNVRSSIAASHYNYLLREVADFEKLDPRKATETHYKSVANKLKWELEEYDNKATGLYGSRKDTKTLYERRENAMTKAYNFYHPISHN